MVRNQPAVGGSIEIKNEVETDVRTSRIREGLAFSIVEHGS
jgi:hypothetical protein